MKYSIFLSLVLITGCYKDYINLSIDYDSAAFNEDSTEIAFVRFVRVSRPAKGITAFPDGGRPQVFYKNVSLFYYKLGDDSLKEIISFGHLPYNKSRWNSHISFKKGNVAFSMVPLGGWEAEINTSEEYKMYHEKFSGIFVYNIEKQKLVRLLEDGHHPVFSHSAEYLAFYDENSLTKLMVADSEGDKKELVDERDVNIYTLQWLNEQELAFRQLKKWYKVNIENGQKDIIAGENLEIQKSVAPRKVEKFVKHIPFKQSGIDLSPVFSKNKNTLIREIVELGGDKNYRKAIIEHLKKDLTEDDIKKILKKIEKHKNGLSGYDKMFYEDAVKETVEQLKGLLN